MTLDDAILKLVHDQEITDQSVFMEHLQRAGLVVTQPTLSRHMRKLSIRKTAGRYQRVEPLLAEPPRYNIAMVEPNLVIIRTRPGHAQPLAVLLDQQAISGVEGTLAGDDTVFIAVNPAAGLRAVAAAVDILLRAR